MVEDAPASKCSFSGRIDRTDWKRHLDSHRLFICELKRFLVPFHLPLLVDRFMGLLRFHCFKQAGPVANLETLQINFQPPGDFRITIAFSNSKEHFSQEYSLKLADILAWPISSASLLSTQRLEIGLLLPSDEPDIIDIVKAPEVWRMRGDHYSPPMNIYSVYQNNQEQQPWYSYYFVVRLHQSPTPIGFVRFYQISRPDVVTPHISQTPYEPVMLSYGLSHRYWGQGLMSEAVSACLPWFVTGQNVREIVAFVEIKNQASHRILQKLGLTACGTLEHPTISADTKDNYKFTIYKS